MNATSKDAIEARLDELSAFRWLLDTERRSVRDTKRLTINDVYKRTEAMKLSFTASGGIWTLECRAGNQQHRASIIAANFRNNKLAYSSLLFALALAIHHYRAGFVDGTQF